MLLSQIVPFVTLSVLWNKPILSPVFMVWSSEVFSLFNSSSYANVSFVVAYRLTFIKRECVQGIWKSLIACS